MMNHDDTVVEQTFGRRLSAGILLIFAAITLAIAILGYLLSIIAAGGWLMYDEGGLEPVIKLILITILTVLVQISGHCLLFGSDYLLGKRNRFHKVGHLKKWGFEVIRDLCFGISGLLIVTILLAVASQNYGALIVLAVLLSGCCYVIKQVNKSLKPMSQSLDHDE